MHRIFLVPHQSSKSTFVEWLREACEQAKTHSCITAAGVLSLGCSLTSVLNLDNTFKCLKLLKIHEVEIIYSVDSNWPHEEGVTSFVPHTDINKNKLFYCHISSFRFVIAVLGDLIIGLFEEFWTKTKHLSQAERYIVETWTKVSLQT